MMKTTESINGYTARFGSLVTDAGRPPTEPHFAEKYRTILLTRFQEGILVVMQSGQPANYPWTIEEIASIAKKLYGEAAPMSNNNKREIIIEPEDVVMHSVSAPVKRRNIGQVGYPRHGGANASSHDAKDCFADGSGSSKPTTFINNSKNQVHRATGNDPSTTTYPCRYCGANWTKGHTCEAYYKAKRGTTGDVNRRNHG
jgi:hypothetical protein